MKNKRNANNWQLLTKQDDMKTIDSIRKIHLYQINKQNLFKYNSRYFLNLKIEGYFVMIPPKAYVHRIFSF